MEGGELSSHKHTQSKTRDTVSLVFSFFLSVALACIMVLTVVRFGLMSKGGLQSVPDDDYYEYLLEYVDEQAYYYTLSTGIDPAVLDDVFDVEEVKTDVNAYITGAFEGYEFQPDTAYARERLLANMRTAFAADGVIIEDASEAEEISNSYADQIMNIYVQCTNPAGVDAFVQVQRVYSRYYPIVMVVLVALSALLVVLILRLHHFLHRALRYIAYAVGGAALMGFVVPCGLLVSGYFKGLNLGTRHLYEAATSLIERLLSLCMMGSVVLFAITLVFVYVISRLRKNKMHRKHRHHNS